MSARLLERPGASLISELFTPESISSPAPIRVLESEDAVLKPSILLLDDDPYMLVLHSRMLRDMGFHQITTAGSAEAALAMLRSRSPAPDVIICDLKMPGIDGIQFLQTLNKGHHTGSVVLLSGQGARIMHAVQRMLSGGRGLVILGAVEKPAGRMQLGSLLARWKRSPLPVAAQPAPSVTISEFLAASKEDQWVLHYQPKVHLQTGELAGMEALVRWNHPTHGLIHPDSFIGVAETGCSTKG
jgi:CheY-like chemotaxis protein